MSAAVYCLTLPEPPIDRDEILRYAGCREHTEDMLRLVDECIDSILPELCYRVCFCEVGVSVQGKRVTLGDGIEVESGSLARCLGGCDKAIVFAATVGIGADRMTARYSHLSASRAVCMQAIGAERVESLCDAFVRLKSEQYKKEGRELCRRFSPGYGDLPLEFQKDIFALLDCTKRIGVTLNDNMLMSPTKSVSAVVGTYFSFEKEK